MCRLALSAVLAVAAALGPLGAAALPAQEEGNMTDPGQTAQFPTRAVVADVPRIGYDVHLCPFPGSLYSLLEYIGDPADYDYLMGVTGACFRRLWNRDDGGNVDLMYLAPEPPERVFAALGYEFRTVPREDKAAMIQAIKESVAQGMPVLGFVLVGPPECGIITGYDQDGETLIGWSYFQDSAKPGYCEVPQWFGTMSHAGLGLILLGEKAEARPTDRETLIAALEWAIELARVPQRPGLPDHASGLAAYDAWADGLEVDADYPADDAEVMSTRAMVHGDQCAMLVERKSAASFLRQMALGVPEVGDQLEAAAALYEEVGELGGIWPGGMPQDAETLRALAGPQFRKEAAQRIRVARDKEAQAVGLLEKALAALRGEPGE